MLEKLASVQPLIGNTPLRTLSINGVNAEVYAKLEYQNFAGSIKSRPAFNILYKGIEDGLINDESIVVESSSGNFAIALAMLCKLIGISFVPVIDPNINPAYEKLLRCLCREVVKVNTLDKTGGYLLTRLEKVHELCHTRRNVFWPNQYENPLNAQAYYQYMGTEIAGQLEHLDYAFIGVSTCGTIIGLSQRLKELYPQIRIVAIDVEGSVIFSGRPQRRFISGIGSSLVTPLVNKARIDEIMHIPQTDIIDACFDLLNDHVLFCGASSGASYSAIRKYFSDHPVSGTTPRVLFLCPDNGDAYLDTVYNPQWRKQVAESQRQALSTPVTM